jgi:hypothetical protein
VGPVIAVVVIDCRVPCLADAVTRMLLAVLTLVITPVSLPCADASAILETSLSGAKMGNRRFILVKWVFVVLCFSFTHESIGRYLHVSL